MTTTRFRKKFDTFLHQAVWNLTFPVNKVSSVFFINKNKERGDLPYLDHPNEPAGRSPIPSSCIFHKYLCEKETDLDLKMICCTQVCDGYSGWQLHAWSTGGGHTEPSSQPQSECLTYTSIYYPTAVYDTSEFYVNLI